MAKARTTRRTAPPAPAIGLWGTFDLENFGDMLFPRILEEELGRRLPEASIRVFAPVGYSGLNRFEEREPAEPLGPWTPERIARLASELDCVVVGPGEILHTRDELLAPHYGVAPEEMRRRAPSRFFIDGLGSALERECPVVWCAVGVPFDVRARERVRFRDAASGRSLISVRDERSRERLRAAGVDREIEVVPDPAFVAERLFPPRLLEKRTAQLRAMNGYPAEPPIVVQGNAGSVHHIPALVPALQRLREERGAPLALLEIGPCHGDGEFAEALGEALPGAVRIPAAGLVDVTAAIAASGGFVGTSLHGSIAALSHGRPHLILGWGGESKLEGFARAIDNPDALVSRPEDVPAAFEKVAALGRRADVVERLQRCVDEHLDRVAEVAQESALRRVGPEPDLAATLQTLARAYEARGRMLVAQQWALADRLDELEGEVARQREEIRRLEQEVAGRVAEVERLLNTKTFRYTAGLRRLYGTLRRRA